MHDLVIRAGMVVDGTGAPPLAADVAVDGDRITAIGTVTDRGRTRDRRARRVRHAGLRRRAHPPRRAGRVGSRRDLLVLARRDVGRARQLRRHLRARAQGAGALARGAHGIGRGHPGRHHPRRARLGLGDLRRVPRRRSTRCPKGVNVGGMVGHCAVRHYAMGERSLDETPATDDDIAAMCDLVDEAMGAGAGLFDLAHAAAPRSRRPSVPGTWADERELLAIADVLGRRGHGVYEVAPRFERPGANYEGTRRGALDGRDQPAHRATGHVRARAEQRRTGAVSQDPRARRRGGRARR